MKRGEIENGLCGPYKILYMYKIMYQGQCGNKKYWSTDNRKMGIKKGKSSQKKCRDISTLQ